MTVVDLPLLPEVEIPPGDPAVLREAVNTYRGSAEQAHRIGAQVRRTVHWTAGGRWSGPASVAFADDGERIAGNHDRSMRVLEEGAGAIHQYANRLEDAQQLARRAQEAQESYNRQVMHLRAQQGGTAGDPAAQAQMQAAAEQLSAEANQVRGMATDAQTMARDAAHNAGAAFGAVAQGAVGIFVPGAATALTPKAAVDALMGFRKEFLAARGGAAVAGSTDEALARYLSGRWPGLAAKLKSFAPALKWGGRAVPFLAAGLGGYQAITGDSTEQRVLGGLTALGGGILTASAFGAFTAGSVFPPAGAAILAGVALYQLGKLTYKHWDDIKSGVSKAAKWTRDKLGDAKDWAADKASDAASAIKKGAGAAADAVSGAAHTVTKGIGTVANALGF